MCPVSLGCRFAECSRFSAEAAIGCEGARLSVSQVNEAKQHAHYGGVVSRAS